LERQNGRPHFTVSEMERLKNIYTKDFPTLL